MNKLSHIAIKESGKAFRIINRPVFEQELNGLPEGKYRVIIKKYYKEKSLPQLGYYYACVLPLFWKHLLDAGWEFKSLDEVDAFAKSRFANTEIVNRDSGEVISIPALKRDFTTVDMMTYINAIRDYDAEYLGGYIPEPEEQIQMELKD